VAGQRVFSMISKKPEWTFHTFLSRDVTDDVHQPLNLSGMILMSSDDYAVFSEIIDV